MKHTLKRNLAIAALLITGLAVLSGCTRRDAPITGELEGAPYPCTWEAAGSICTLSIDGELPANAQWELYENAGFITVEPQRAIGKFKVTAQESGSGTVTVALRESGLPVEKGVDFNFCFSVDEDKKITVNSAGYTLLDADTFSTQSGKTACWEKSTVGGQFLYLTGTEWTVVSTRGVAVYGPTVDGGNVRLEVMAGEETAKRDLVLQSSDGESIVFTFEYSNNALIVGDAAAKTAEETEALLRSPDAAEETAAEEVDYGPAHEATKELPDVTVSAEVSEDQTAADYGITTEMEEALEKEDAAYWSAQQRPANQVE